MKRPLHKASFRQLLRFIALFAICLLALQATFLLRVASMSVVDPQSTTFERSEAWRLATSGRLGAWRQRWLPYAALPLTLKRAVIASEDSGFVEHSGVEWDALEKAWDRNVKAEATVERLNERNERRAQRSSSTSIKRATAKLVGASTISQQLAKNLFLSPERNFVRKSQELVITLMLEALLSKERILEIYLNSVEWGEGVFGAEGAARRYYGIGASSLSAAQAAQLAVMLPAPKRFEKRPQSPYVAARAATILARMPAVEVP